MKLKGCKVVVTGGAGFIGSHLADRLLGIGAQVVVLDNLDPYYSGKEANFRHNLKNPNYHFVKADILDLDVLNNALKNADIVFHLAAQPGVRYSMEHPVKTNRINVTGTVNVLTASKRCELKKFIYASSSSVYGEPKYLPMDERHPTNPISIYGASKLAGEKYCRIFNDHLYLPTVILRYHTVYGPRQRPDMAIHKWVKKIFDGDTIAIYGEGDQTRDFTYCDDIVSGTILAAEADDVRGEIFNLGSRSRVRINDVIQLILQMTDKEDLKPVHQPPAPGDVSDTYADIFRAIKLLGYEPKTSLDVGLKSFLDWFWARSRTGVNEV